MTKVEKCHNHRSTGKPNQAREKFFKTSETIQQAKIDSIQSCELKQISGDELRALDVALEAE